MAEEEKCEECGKVLKDLSHEPYCQQCDEKLDRQFDTIEDNMLIFKELLDSEIEILKRFENEDIEDLFKRVYNKLAKEAGGLKQECVRVLNKLKKAFSLNETALDLNKLPEIKDIKSTKPKDQCPQCNKKIKEDFNLCPYCGYKINDDFIEKF